jgi:hypothetical protein
MLHQEKSGNPASHASCRCECTWRGLKPRFFAEMLLQLTVSSLLLLLRPAAADFSLPVRMPNIASAPGTDSTKLRFRPKTFRINFQSQIWDQIFPPKTNRHIYLLVFKDLDFISF